MAVSRELSGDDKSSFQRNRSRNYLSEANYVEFSGVKVIGTYIRVTAIFFPNVAFLMLLNPLQVVTPTGNVLVEDLTLRVEQGSNLLITGEPFISRE